jgi:hypothetical protein
LAGVENNGDDDDDDDDERMEEVEKVGGWQCGVGTSYHVLRS